MKKISASVALFLFLAAALCGASTCPSPAEVEAGLKKLFPRARKLSISRVSPSPVPGFCEAVIDTGGPFKNVVYVDSGGRFAFLGQLVDLKQGENLTRKRLQELSRLSPAKLKELEKLVAFTAGKGGKSVYLITDPDCPFCKRLEKTLYELINEGKLTVKVILMPLEKLHPKAKEKCVAIICDGKGFPELMAGYTSTNQCEEGRRKVEEARKYLASLGIRGTPVLVLPDGRLLRGAVPKERLVKLLGI